MDQIIASAIQKSYNAGADYLEALTRLGKTNHQHPITVFHLEAVNVAYAELVAAQYDLNTVLDGH